MYDTFMSTLTQEMKDALNNLLSNVHQDCGIQEQFLDTSPIFQHHIGEFDVYLKKNNGWRTWPNCPILEHACPYGKQSAQGPNANLRTNDVDGYIKILAAMIDIYLD